MANKKDNDSCYSCNSCYSSKGLRMSEKMIFCLGEGWDKSKGEGFQKNYRVFNKDVSEKEYEKIEKLLKDIEIISTEWIKQDCGGYLTTYSYEKAWRITKSEYDKKATELKERQHEIDIKMKQYTKADESFRITVSYLLDLASRAHELFKSSEVEEKRQLLNFVLSNLTLDKKKLLFKLKEPFDAIVDANNRKEWLPLLDKFRTELLMNVMNMLEEVKLIKLYLRA